MNYASVPANNNLKSRLVLCCAVQYICCIFSHGSALASTSGYCSRELKRNSKVVHYFKIIFFVFVLEFDLQLNRRHLVLFVDFSEEADERKRTCKAESLNNPRAKHTVIWQKETINLLEYITSKVWTTGQTNWRQWNVLILLTPFERGLYFNLSGG